MYKFVKLGDEFRLSTEMDVVFVDWSQEMV